MRLWAIVDSLVTDISEKEAYLAFAHELAAAERSSSFVHRPSSVIPRKQSDSRNLSAMETRRDPSIGVGVTEGRDPSTSGAQRTGGTSGVTGPMSERPRPFPDFSMRTKRVVMKWFRRGLSGHLMWLIGDRILNGY